jgi:hypothetical protein
MSTTAEEELYGQPLTYKDIEESARVCFQVLDEGEKHADSMAGRICELESSDPV